MIVSWYCKRKYRIMQVKSVETRDSELTQMNKSYFDELQRHVDDTSEELRRTFAGKPVIEAP